MDLNTWVLRIKINEGKNCFRDHKNDKIINARQHSNLIMSVISRSSNKLMVGKTFWKNVVLAEILYGSDIVTYNKKEIGDMQRTENQAYRYISGAPRYAPICTLRGEIGASPMNNRDRVTKM